MIDRSEAGAWSAALKTHPWAERRNGDTFSNFPADAHLRLGGGGNSSTATPDSSDRPAGRCSPGVRLLHADKD